MPKTIEVIESRRWVNAETGQTASIYGSVPYVSDADKPNWSIETVGWTWKVTDSSGSVTVGLGRPPEKTKEEAEDRAYKLRALWA